MNCSGDAKYYILEPRPKVLSEYALLHSLVKPSLFSRAYSLLICRMKSSGACPPYDEFRCIFPWLYFIRLTSHSFQVSSRMQTCLPLIRIVQLFL